MIQISVVVPTYRRPDLLKRCLQALTGQELDTSQYEILVVSDGPCFESRSCVNEMLYKSVATIRYLYLPQKGGPAAARNLGWRTAAGAIIAFTDDDCIPASNWLTQIMQYFYNPLCHVIYGRVKVPTGHQRLTDFERQTTRLETPAFVTANVACRRSVLEQVGGFDEQYKVAWREDSDLEFALLSNGETPYYAPDCLVYHPVRTASWGISIKEQQKSLYNALLRKKYPLFYKLYIKESPPGYYYLSVAGIFCALACFALGRFTTAVTCLGIALLGIIYFIYKRLSQNSLSLRHITEMVLTSLCIPFLSVYWNWYGNYKFRKIKPVQNNHAYRYFQGLKTR
jgi:GT2 family glycosyltransferase